LEVEEFGDEEAEKNEIVDSNEVNCDVIIWFKNKIKIKHLLFVDAINNS
jgi:hypothetical protein